MTKRVSAKRLSDEEEYEFSVKETSLDEQQEFPSSFFSFQDLFKLFCTSTNAEKTFTQAKILNYGFVYYYSSISILVGEDAWRDSNAESAPFLPLSVVAAM